MKIFNLFLIMVLGFTSSILAETKPANIDLGTAKQYFKEIEKHVELDNGKLWGVKLDGPFMFVDEYTGEIVTSKQDKQNTLKKLEGLYVGKLEDNIGFANTAINWHDERWTMVIWQHIPVTSYYSRLSLFMHESWHNKQEEIGLLVQGGNNPHLDKKWGKILLRLEWRALISAIEDEVNRKKHIENALIFRNYRREVFPEASSNENKFEILEGLAEYTGNKLCGMPIDTLILRVKHKMEVYEENSNYLYSFSYQNGALYGALLDLKSKNWQQGATKEFDFGETIGKVYNIILPNNLEEAFNKLRAYYNAKQIIEEEQEYEGLQLEREEYYKKLFLNQAVLEIANNGINITFNPMDIFSLDTIGVVYTSFTAKGKWGELEVKDGVVLRANDWTRFTVPEPVEIEETYIKGKGWEIKLKTGWKAVRKGCKYYLERK